MVMTVSEEAMTHEKSPGYKRDTAVLQGGGGEIKGGWMEGS